MASPIVEALVAHAKGEAPLEACGVLAGREEDDGVRVTKTHPVTNAHPEPEFNYTLDPDEHLSVLHKTDDANLELVGYYHSHPKGPDGPSVIDAARSPWPGVAYVIVSPSGVGSVTSWRWDPEARLFRQDKVRFDQTKPISSPDR